MPFVHDLKSADRQCAKRRCQLFDRHEEFWIVPIDVRVAVEDLRDHDGVAGGIRDQAARGRCVRAGLGPSRAGYGSERGGSANGSCASSAFVCRLRSPVTSTTAAVAC